ncbi:MAG: CDP-diacylglycerol--glycerol-3-phosphate 3-phosphatidyltransferase [Lachnospiraceae bacterium]|nr:CDP-diacylglycerol--glycerol-3-phosphate 3-phosphatidyltransferase [Lachnospiraceae bacterium]
MNIPNRLTLSRFVIAPLAAWVLLSGFFSSDYRDFIALCIFLAGASTDFLDGYIARSRDMITTFGIFTDPVADKVLLLCTMISLVALGRMPPGLVIALVSRDTVMTGFRLIAAERQQVIAALPLGKVKTVAEMLLAACLLMKPHMNIPQGLVFLLAAASVAFAYISLVQVLIQNRGLLKDTGQRQK